MSSDKVKIVCTSLIILFVIPGCKKSFEPPPHQLFENPQLVLKTAKDLLGENISFTSSGFFESDTLKSIVAGVEISEQNNWGIKFHLICWEEGEFKVKTVIIHNISKVLGLGDEELIKFYKNYYRSIKQ